MSQPELPQCTAIFGLAQSTNIELVWDLHAKTKPDRSTIGNGCLVMDINFLDHLSAAFCAKGFGQYPP